MKNTIALFNSCKHQMAVLLAIFALNGRASSIETVMDCPLPAISCMDATIIPPLGSSANVLLSDITDDEFDECLNVDHGPVLVTEFGTDFSEFTLIGDFNGSRYYRSNAASFNWDEAHSLAISKGGTLAIIESQEENDFIANNLVSDSFIGYRDVVTEGEFLWINGSLSIFTNWNLGEPNDGSTGEDFGVIRTNGKWNDVTANAQRALVVEMPIPGDNQVNAVTVVENDIGESVACHSFINLVDITPPSVICHETSTLPVGNGDVIFEFASAFDNGSTDDITEQEDLVFSYSNTDINDNTRSFDCGNIGVVELTIFAWDEAGNVSEGCAVTLNVVDQTLPTCITQDITVSLDENGMAIVNAEDADNGSFDVCTDITKSLSITEVDCSHLGDPLSVILFVEDESANVSECDFLVTVQDIDPPVAVCQDSTIILTLEDPIAVLSLSDIQSLMSASTDNCGIDESTISANITEFDCSMIGENLVDITFSDMSGNLTSCQSTITVADEVVATCADIQVVLDTDGTASILASDLYTGLESPCSELSIEADQLDFTCEDLGVNNIEVSISNDNGLMTSCVATVTILDQTPPTLICEDVVVSLDENGEAIVLIDDIVLFASDNCEDLSFSRNLNQEGVLETSDLAFHPTSEASCPSGEDFPVGGFVGDLPRFYDLHRVFIPVAGDYSFKLLDLNGGIDFIGVLYDINFDPTDLCLNILESNDDGGGDLDPKIDVSIEIPGTYTLFVSTFGVSDNEELPAPYIWDVTTPDIFGPIESSFVFDCSHIGNNTVEVIARDNGNNTTTCTSNIEVQSNLPPICNAQDITVSADPTNLSGIITVDAQQLDNGSVGICSELSYAIRIVNDDDVENPFGPSLDFDCGDVGMVSVELQLTDANGLISICPAQITVEDNVSPYLSCPNELSVSLNSNGVGAIFASSIEFMFGVYDACGIDQLLINGGPVAFFDCSHVNQENLLEITVTDIHGNYTECAVSVNVSDQRDPESIPSDITLSLDEAGVAILDPQQFGSASEDNCTIGSYEITQSEFSCSDTSSPVEVMLTVTDDSGNTDVNSAMVTVIDDKAPVVVCQSIEVSLDGLGMASITAEQVNNGSTDNCGIASMELDRTTFDCADLESPQVVVLTVTDLSGNVSTCETTVEVLPNLVLDCVDFDLVLDEFGEGILEVVDVLPNFIENCSISEVSISPGGFDCDQIGSNIVTIVATDINGGTAECSVEVTVIDVSAPVMSCEDISVFLDDQGSASIELEDLNVTYEGCGEIITEIHGPTSVDCDGIDLFDFILLGDFDGKRYYQSQASFTWQQAKLDAIAHGGILTSIDNIELNNFLAGEINDESWIGFNDFLDEDNFVWMDGVVRDFENWGEGEPNNLANEDAVELRLNGFWNDGSHDISQPYILETLIPTENQVSAAIYAEDEDGRTAVCLSLYNVQDNIAPLAQCGEFFQSLGEDNTTTVDPSFLDAGSSDNCGISAVELSQTFFDCSDVGVNELILTVTDNFGNTSTCDATIHIFPRLICQDVTVQLDETGQASIEPIELLGSECGEISSMELSQSTFDCSHIGDNEVLLSVGYGTSVTLGCNSIVTIQDVHAPEMTCPDDIVVSTNSTSCTQSVAMPDIEAIDQCDANTAVEFNAGDVELIIIGETYLGFFPVGITTVTASTVDVAGNVTTCEFDVIVEDNVNPVIEGCDIIGPIAQMSEVSQCGANVTWDESDLVFNDNCIGLGVGLSLSSNFEPGSFFEVGTTVVEYTVTDVSGNTATCTFDVIVTPFEGLASFDVFTASLAAQFTDTSPEAVAWSWDFGDGNNSLDQNPIHNYATAGTYEVCLTINDACGEEKMTCEEVSIVDEGNLCIDDISFETGWNLISLDVAPEDNSIVSIFEGHLGNDISFITGFDGSSLVFDPAAPLPVFNTLQTFEPGNGYWVQCNNSFDFTVAGECIDPSFKKDLVTGWNLVGYIPQESTPATVYFNELESTGALEFVSGFIPSVGTITYDPAAPLPIFNTLTELQNGFGYWVNTNQDVSGPDWINGDSQVEIRSDNTDDWGNAITASFDFIYGSILGASNGDLVDVIDQDRNLVAQLEVVSDKYLMTVPIYGDDALTEDKDGLSYGDELSFVYNGTVSETTILFEGSMKVHNVGLDFSLVNIDLLTQDLEQVSLYPNPFTENAIINIDAHQSASYNITILDADGRIVRSQDLGKLPKGKNEINLERGDLPSGLYQVVIHNTDANSRSQLKAIIVQ